ncbi:MAG: thiol reductant ABC exporter subunit CydD [Candidatus Thiodiazotropha sp.]
MSEANSIDAKSPSPSDWLKTHKPLAGNRLKLAVVFGMFSGWLLILQAGCLAQAISGVIFEHHTLHDVMPWLWTLLLIFAIRAGLAWASEWAAHAAAQQVKLSLRQTLYDRLRQLGPAWLNEQRTGDMVNTLSDGIEALEDYYARFLPAIALMAMVPLSILVFVFPIDWISGLVMLGTAPLIPLFMILIGKGAEKRNQKQWQQLAYMSAHFLDVIQGLTSLKLFNASRREAVVIARISDDYRKATMSVLRLAFLSSFALEFFSTVSIAIVAVLIGFRLFWGELDFLYGFFVLLLAPEFYLPLRNMGTHYHARMAAIGAAENMLKILEAPIPQRQVAPAPGNSVYGPIGLTLEAVGHTYPDGRRALDGLNLSIKPGERIAIVGPSGAGKSTLLNLLLGFLPLEEGQIRINGEALQDIDSIQWRKNLAWVPQRPHLFQGTLADNIRLARPDADQADVERAAQRAHAHSFIQQLPEGYQTRVGEGARGLSGGQIQRLALARAFLKDAPLVILDEATAHLDLESEGLIRQAMEELSQERTVIMVAHRLITVRDIPRILVLDQGRLVEFGNHTALMAKQGLYHRLASAYAGGPA